LRLRQAQLQSSLYSLKNYYPELTDNLKKFRAINVTKKSKQNKLRDRG